MTSLDIAIPHFNNANGLLSSLSSVDAQTWQAPKRILIVDDGSTSEHLNILRTLAESRDDILLLENRENRGRSYSRNRLLDTTDAEFLAWIDAGDTWSPEKLARQFSVLLALDDSSSTWVTCDYSVRLGGAPPRALRQSVDQDQLKALLGGHSLRAYLWTTIARSDAFKKVGRFDERLPRLEDLDFFIRFVAEGGRLLNTPDRESLCEYNKDDLGVSSAVVDACYRYLWEKHGDLYRQYGARFFRQARFVGNQQCIRLAQVNGDQRLLLYMARALRERPIRSLRDALRIAVKSKGTTEP